MLVITVLTNDLNLVTDEIRIECIEKYGYSFKTIYDLGNYISGDMIDKRFVIVHVPFDPMGYNDPVKIISQAGPSVDELWFIVEETVENIKIYNSLIGNQAIYMLRGKNESIKTPFNIRLYE